MKLQQSVGAKAVQRLIESPYIQTKLQVSEPEDQSEKEADDVAESVMRSPESGTVAGASGTQASPVHSQKSGGPTSGLENQLAGSGSASPLPNDVRDFMEPRIGADLSGVRVHTGSDSAQMNKELRSQAFTHGQDIYYANGKSPGKDALTAHELTHVVQQSGAGAGNLINRAPDPQEEKKKPEIYWFQNKPPEKPREEKSGIEITPKGQVVLDPRVPSIQSTELGSTIKVQFAGLDTDFQAGKPTPAFAAAEKTILEAISGALADLHALPDIKDAPSMKAALAQRREDEIVRARLKEAGRNLDGRTLNIFIATNLSSAELMSPGTPSPSTSQIYVRPADIGDRSKLQAAIRIPLISLTGGTRVAIGADKKPEETTTPELTAEKAKEALLHELVHVMLIDRGQAAVQIWPNAMSGAVTGPSDVKSLAEDVLFRYIRAQEEIFVYDAIAGVYSSFKENKDRYELYVAAVEAFVKSEGGKIEQQKPVAIDVKEKIGEKKKEKVTWSIAYKLPKGLKVDKPQMETLKTLQKLDIGS